MSWPLISDFSRMIRNPAVAFKDPDLKACEVEVDHLGQPRPRSGNFATVYRGFCADGSEVAIRVFNRRADERRERYAACSRFFKDHPLHCMLPFDYTEKGVRSASDGKMYPLVTMDWVDGLTLFEWTRARCKEDYGEALRIGADVWLQLVTELREAGVAHGDLQHGNVMVTRDGHFKLVDYDCLAVPELMGRTNLEIGLPPYQHPQRNGETVLCADLDNFSALLIYTALRALAAQPMLWFEHVETPAYDKLLFRPEDFQQPDQSRLYADLLRSPDPIVRGLAHNLFQFAAAPTDQTPAVDDVLLWSSSLTELIQNGDWDRVVLRVERLRPGEQVPAEYQAHIASARQRVDVRKAMQEAFDEGNETELARLYQPAMLQGYAAAADIAEKASKADQVAHAVEVLKSSLALKCWDAFRQTWKESEGILAGRPSGEPLRHEYQQLEAVSKLRTLLGDPASDDDKVLSIWRLIRAAGGHETVAQLKPQVEKRAARQRFYNAWEAVMKRSHGSPSLKVDKLMIASWVAQHFDGWPKAEATRPDYDAALARVAQFERFQSLADESGEEAEKSMLGVAEQLTHGYHPLVEERAKAVLQRAKAHEKFARRVSSAKTEEQIIGIWRRLKESGEAQHAGAGLRARYELAKKRIPLLKTIKGLASLPPDAADKGLLDVWNDELFEDCREADAWRERYAAALERSRIFTRIEEALETGDSEAARRLTTASCLDGFALPQATREKLRQAEDEVAQQAVRQKNDLLEALLGNDRKRFIGQFDLGLLREICAKSPHHEHIVETWTRAELAPVFVASLQPLGVDQLESGGFHAAWEWPEKFAAVRIRIVVCSKQPDDKTRIDTVDSAYAAMVYRKGWLADNKGHSIAFNEDWADHYVALWGVFDLGFQKIHTPCVPLGQLSLPKKTRGWNPFRRSE